MNKKQAGQIWARRLKVAAFAAFVSVSTGVAASAPTVSITHANGQTDVAANPQTTVVLDAALLDVLHALEIPVAGVPTSRYTGELAPYADDKIVKVGSMFEPDVDAIRALNPDLIIAGRRATKAFDTVTPIAPAVNLAFDQQDLVNSVTQTTRTLASLYGKQDVAEPLLEKLTTSVKALQEKTATAGTGLLVFTTGGKLISQGPESRFGVLFNDFGVQPAMTDFPEGRGVELTAELLESVNPDWIYVLDRDVSLGREGTPAQELLQTVSVDKTTAGQKDQIVYLDAYNWYMLDGAGLRSLQENVDQLLQALSAQTNVNVQ